MISASGSAQRAACAAACRDQTHRQRSALDRHSYWATTGWDHERPPDAECARTDATLGNMVSGRLVGARPPVSPRSGLTRLVAASSTCTVSISRLRGCVRAVGGACAHVSAREQKDAERVKLEHDDQTVSPSIHSALKCALCAAEHRSIPRCADPGPRACSPAPTTRTSSTAQRLCPVGRTSAHCGPSTSRLRSRTRRDRTRRQARRGMGSGCGMDARRTRVAIGKS